MTDMTRVVITGMGAVTPLGNDVKTFWQHAVAGVSGAGQIRRLDGAQFRIRIVCGGQGLGREKYLDGSEVERSDLCTQYALCAALEAMEDAGLGLWARVAFDVGVDWVVGQG